MEQDTDEHPLRAAIGEEVRSLMGRHRVSQKELGAVLGLTQSPLSKRLSGQIPWTVDELETVAAFFGADLTELWLRIADNPRSVNASHVVPPVQLAFALAS